MICRHRTEEEIEGLIEDAKETVSTKESILDTLLANKDNEFIIQFEIAGGNDEKEERVPS